MKNDKFGDNDYTPRWGPGDRRTKKVPKVNKEVDDMNGIKAIDKSYRKEYLAPVNKAMAEEEYYRIQLYKMFPVQALSDDLDKSYSRTSYTNVDALIQFHKSSFGYTVQKTYELLSKGMQSFQKALWTPPPPSKTNATGGATSHPASPAGVAATQTAATAAGSVRAGTPTTPPRIIENKSMKGQAGLNEAHQNLAAMNRSGIISEHLNPSEKETRSVGEQMHWKGQHGVSDSRAMNIGLANNGTGPAWNSKEGATPILKINDHEGHEQIFAHHASHGWVPSSGISMDKKSGKDVVGFHTGKQSEYHQGISDHLNTFVPGHLFRDTNHHDQVANLNLAKDNGHDEFHAHGADSANTLDKVTKLHEDLTTSGRDYKDPVKGVQNQKPSGVSGTAKMKPGTKGSEGFENSVASKGLDEQGDTNMRHVRAVHLGLSVGKGGTTSADANRFFNGRGKKAGRISKRKKVSWDGNGANHADKSAYGTY